MNIQNGTTYFTIKEVAAHLRVTPETIKRRIRAGDIKAVRLGPRIIRIPTASLEEITGRGVGAKGGIVYGAPTASKVDIER